MSEQQPDSNATTAPGPDAAPAGLMALSGRPAGSLTSDLTADTDDVSTLKQRLGRARERLSFYESFDRIIQENIRRSSELMIEATELHERAERVTTAQAEAQSTLDQQRAADRAHYAALLNDLHNELDRTRAALDGLSARVSAALAGLAAEDTATPSPTLPGAKPVVTPAPSSSAQLIPAATSEATAARAPSAAGQRDGGSAPSDAGATPSTSARPAASVPEAAPAAPRTVEVLVHGVPTARVAISLQNHLRGLDGVTAVEAREFVEGLLRLQVTATGDLGDSPLTGWIDGDGADVLRARPDLLEISLPGVTER